MALIPQQRSLKPFRVNTIIERECAVVEVA